MKAFRASTNSGVALVTTVIVIAILAVVAVAFMQSVSTDRLSSRTMADYFRARLAAEAGLAEAMALIHQNAQSFTYISGSEMQGGSYRTFIQTITGDSGTWEINGGRVYLDSGPPTEAPASLVVAGSLDNPHMVRDVGWISMPPDTLRPNESQRYAFWVDDAGSKQNLEWWGGGGQRGVITNLADVPLVLPDPSGQGSSPFPPAALSELQGRRAPQASPFSLDGTSFVGVRSGLVLPTVDTFKLVAPSVATSEGFNPYHFTRHSASGATAPSGQPKLNFERLRQHVNNLSSEQGPDSPKARLVEELLKDEPEGSENWGGGSLSWLAQTEKYSEVEQKQIVANIIDYLDDDLIPTTDSLTDPTYIGVEMLKQADGTVRGHPFISHFGFGLQFNITGSAEGPRGAINSTRILCAMGLINPWTTPLPKESYRVDLEVEIQGTVTGEGALSSIMEYFATDGSDSVVFNERIEGSSWEGGATIPANGGFLAAGGPNVNLRFTNTFLPDRLPRQPTFSDVKYSVKRARIFFRPSSGVEEVVVATIANLPDVDANPSTFTLPVPTGGSFTLTYPTGAPTNELYLSTDPRLGFRADSFVSSETTYVGSLPQPTQTVTVFGDVIEGDFDGRQGVPDNFTGLTSVAMTNHFNRFARGGISTIGEIGYIWTGKPWQTLNLHDVDDPVTADWNLMDYVTAGRSVGAGAGELITSVLPLRQAVSDTNASVIAALVAGGGFNINTRKAPTVTAVVTNAPDLAETAANIIMNSEPGAFASAYGQIANLITESDAIVQSGADTKFGKESVQRALANIAVNHSRIFTVYSVGEYRMGGNVARAQLEADVFVGVDPQTGSAIIQIINQRFL